MKRKIRFGIQTPQQMTTWENLRSTWKLIEQLGYDTAWLFDHFFPILADPAGPCFEGWIGLTALAAETTMTQVGILVTGNTYRNPAVLAKMAATLDHTSGGRLVMGLGAGWFELEHRAFDIPFYTTAQRINRCDESIEIIKRLWTEDTVDFDGQYYRLSGARCDPKPLQRPRPPLMIGGSGEKLMLRVIARHADQWNTFGPPELFRHKIGVLKEHCASVGRKFEDIEVSWAGTMLVTESAAEKSETVAAMARAFGAPPEAVEPGLLVGSPSELRDRIHRYIEIGVTHFIGIANPPFNHDSLRRFAEEVTPAFRT
ncbi:MAG TPA: LLM class F420-dependent oxidoreductase [Blastocatellia bacterium]|nr:LLM class F420-dependent oxidoreductase [Blastocatellia bacterium]